MDAIRDALGGGTLPVWAILAGLIITWIALKTLTSMVRLAVLGAAAALILGGTVPWAGDALGTDVADCVQAAVREAAEGWRTAITKRITVEQLSGDARCADGGVGLAAGSGVARLRTFYDVPFQTYDVTPAGADARTDLDRLRPDADADTDDGEA